MQNSSEILTILESMGLKLSLSGEDKLAVTPRNRITVEAREIIKEHKAELLVFLKSRQPKPYFSPDSDIMPSSDGDKPSQSTIDERTAGDKSKELGIQDVLATKNEVLEEAFREALDEDWSESKLLTHIDNLIKNGALIPP